MWSGVQNQESLLIGKRAPRSLFLVGIQWISPLRKAPVRLATCKSLDSPEKGMSTKCWKMSKNCPKNVQELSGGLKTQVFGQLWPIWSMLLFGNTVQGSPITMSERIRETIVSISWASNLFFYSLSDTKLLRKWCPENDIFIIFQEFLCPLNLRERQTLSRKCRQNPYFFLQKPLQNEFVHEVRIVCQQVVFKQSWGIDTTVKQRKIVNDYAIVREQKRHIRKNHFNFWKPPGQLGVP